MKIAIDKTCLKYLDKLKGHELIYIFYDEPLDELLKLNMHCIHKSKINNVDINASKYMLNAIKTVQIENIDKIKMPEKKDYRFCVIIPSYNNDHRRYKWQNIFTKMYRKCIKSNI